MVALPHFKGFLAMPAIRDYIVDNLLNNNVLLADILEDTQINVLNKLRMIEKYPMFVKAVYDPESLTDWKKRKPRVKI
jgi:hypothetical protein